MRNIPVLTFLLLVLTFNAFGQVDLAYYLPTDVSYDKSIPTPKGVLGYEVGEWHVSHDQLIYYMRTLSKSSERIVLQEFAKTYEDRPLMHLIITAPENHSNLEEIRQQHVALTDPSSGVSPEEAKLVHWMGYSIHGNEASGSNAALVAAYYLAAAQSPTINDVLENTVIVFDPSYNPDGLQRFSTWVNMHKSSNLVPDPAAREFDEMWPGGRTNHYWFDMNRDWMPVQLPESKGRIAQFHNWKPNVLTDHHEMGTNSTFFFQPGILSRKNPLTPMANVRMTEKIAEYHASMLDSIGSLYYSEESFDDYYIGKGSTYPDLNGGVGILFEQGSARGHLQENQFGTISFPQAIRNHFTTSLSTLRAVHQMRGELLSMQNDFYKESLRMAGNDAVKAIVFGSEKDPMRSFHLMDLINQHDIAIHPVKGFIKKNGKSFAEDSYIVPLNQPQYRLIKSMFEKRTAFQDSLFYDVSTWTLPLAFNLDYAELSAKGYSSSNLGELISESPTTPKGTVSGNSDYAYIFEPYGYYTQRAIMRLVEEEVVVEVSHAPHGTSTQTFARGSIVIPVGIQREKKEKIDNLVKVIAEEDGIDVYALNTGLSTAGSDLGSREFEVLEKPEVAVLVGDGVSSYEAGEVWHLLDQRYGMQVTLLPVASVNRDISRYNKLIFPNGSYRDISARGIDNLKKWVSSGGVIVTWKNGGKWLADNEISGAKYVSPEEDKEGYKRYVDLSQTRGAQVIGGTIFEAKLDLGHPITYGLVSETIPLFRNHSLMMEKSTNQYANPIVYTDSPLLSGYVSEEKLGELKSTPAITISQMGRGRVINFTDNPNFRAFWYGTNKLFMNALFFGQTISSGAAE